MVVLGEQRIHEMLSGLPPVRRAAFAVGCAERLFPAYCLRPEYSPGELAATRKALDELWEEVEAGRSGRHIDYQDFAQELLPDPDSQHHSLDVFAEDAVSATVYACECLESGDVQAAVWSSRREHEAAYQIACVVGRLEHASIEKIDRSPYMQLVYCRQHEDLTILCSDKSPLRRIAHQLRILGQPVGQRMAQWAKQYQVILEKAT
jgi:hypothetical protein